jgi:hypothetical protein
MVVAIQALLTSLLAQVAVLVVVRHSTQQEVPLAEQLVRVIQVVLDTKELVEATHAQAVEEVEQVVLLQTVVPILVATVALVLHTIQQ